MIDCTPKYFSAIDQNILLACKSLKYSFFPRHKWLTCMRIFWPYRLDTVGVMKLETNYNLINKLLKKLNKYRLKVLVNLLFYLFDFYEKNCLITSMLIKNTRIKKYIFVQWASRLFAINSWDFSSIKCTRRFGDYFTFR